MATDPVPSEVGLAARVRASASPALRLRTARALTVVGAAALFLVAAGTIHVVYAVPPSYFVLGLACLVALPAVYAGWRGMPPALTVCAVLLLLVYVVALLVAEPAHLVGNARAGDLRGVVYAADLLLGLAVLGLIVGLWPSIRAARPLVAALVLGGGIGGAYAAYQWIALHYGLPLRDINNTTDSSGITQGAFQGNGILGWARARGTFIEPHFLAVYLAPILPLAVAWFGSSSGRTRKVAAGATFFILCGLAVTSSVPPLAALGVAAIAVVAFALVARGRVALSAVAGATLAAALVIAPIAITSPGFVSHLTGRSSSVLTATTNARTGTWRRAIDIWEQRPEIGFGPGQSSVQLAAYRDLPPSERPHGFVPLQSAQGLWASALVDGGVPAIGAWTLFFLAVAVYGVVSVARRPTALGAAALLAALVAIADSETTGDRLAISDWVILGVLLLAARSKPREQQPAEADR